MRPSQKPKHVEISVGLAASLTVFCPCDSSTRRPSSIRLRATAGCILTTLHNSIGSSYTLAAESVLAAPVPYAWSASRTVSLSQPPQRFCMTRLRQVPRHAINGVSHSKITSGTLVNSPPLVLPFLLISGLALSRGPVKQLLMLCTFFTSHRTVI